MASDALHERVSDIEFQVLIETGDKVGKIEENMFQVKLGVTNATGEIANVKSEVAGVKSEVVSVKSEVVSMRESFSAQMSALRSENELYFAMFKQTPLYDQFFRTFYWHMAKFERRQNRELQPSDTRILCHIFRELTAFRCLLRIIQSLRIGV